MEGAHKQQRLVSDAIIVGDKVEAAKRRRRAQHGAAAAGRRGESIKVARARNGAINLKVLEKDADEAIKAGTGLVACRRRSSTSRRSRAVVGQVCGGVRHEGARVPNSEASAHVNVAHVAYSGASLPAGASTIVASGAREGRRAWRRTRSIRVGVSETVQYSADRVASEVGSTYTVC